MTNFPGPPLWASVATYTQNQSEINGNNGFYYVCTTSGTSSTVQPTWASVFGATTTDGTVSWITAQRSRQPWQASKAYQAGLIPFQGSGFNTTASISAISPVIHSFAVAGIPISPLLYVPIGAQVVSASVAGGTTVVGVTSTSITLSANPTGTGTGVTVIFNQYPYPWPDQIVTAASVGSPVVQCIFTGSSASVQPTWPSTLGASVTDGSAAWATVAFN